MSLKEQITEDMKAAMRAKETQKLGTIRMLTAAIKQKEVDDRIEITDTHVLAIIEKMIKQRKDSITQFEAGARQDLAFQTSLTHLPTHTLCSTTLPSGGTPLKASPVIAGPPGGP